MKMKTQLCRSWASPAERITALISQSALRIESSDMKKLIAVSIMFLLAGCFPSERSIGISYLPFEYQTYEPITIDKIDQYGLCKNEFIHSDSEYFVIENIFKGLANGKLNKNFIRMKIVGLQPLPIYIDRDGGVGGGLEGRLIENDLDILLMLVGECNYEMELSR